MDNGQQPAPQNQDNTAPQDNAQQPRSEEDEWTGATADYLLDKGFASDKPKETQDANGNQPVQTNANAGEDVGSDDKGAKTGEEGAVSDDSKKDGDDDVRKNGEGNGDSGNGQAAGQEADQDADNLGDYRPTRAEIEADRKQTVEEIRKEMFSDVQTELTDADGDPIKTIEDVQKLINPNTGQKFTEAEAGAWLLAAQQHLNKQLKETEERVEQVAEVQLTLKEEMFEVAGKYKDLLAANPSGIREKVWAAYEKTLKRDPKTDIILEAPVSLKEHYETMLAPYEAMADRLAADAEKQQDDRKTQQQQQVQQQRQNARSDRQDIIGGGKINTKDPEEAEWEQAAKNYYEG